MLLFIKDPYHAETKEMGINNSDRTNKKTLLIFFSFLSPIHTHTTAATTRRAKSRKMISTSISLLSGEIISDRV